MVVFELIKKNGGVLNYHYYPEGDRDYEPGIIVLDTLQDEIYVLTKAKLDKEYEVQSSELNAMKDAINEMRMEDGRPLLTEDEFPIETEPYHCCFYADHAMAKIKAAYDNGEVIEKGSSVWY